MVLPFESIPPPPPKKPVVAAPAWLKILAVEWVDSASVNGGLWVDKDRIDNEAMTLDGLAQRTVGFLVEESDEVLLVAQSIGDQLGAVLAIPKLAIRRVTEVGP